MRKIIIFPKTHADFNYFNDFCFDCRENLSESNVRTEVIEMQLKEVHFLCESCADKRMTGLSTFHSH